MIVTSDACYPCDSNGPPTIGASIVYDSLAFLRSVEKIRNIANKTNATVVFGHDHQQINELKLAPDSFYD